MCGICGIVEKTAKHVDETELYRMTDAMIHRGPDDEGYFVHQGVGLGFRRLSIVDIAHGNQPLCNETQTVWVVFNGEIYNYKPLRNQLTALGHRFRTDTDTEVIVHLYEEKGIDLLQELRGMFAMAIYDLASDELYLARDYFGIKPLYYAQQDGALLFASELKSILASQRVARAVSAPSLWNYLTFQYVPDPDTMFQGIFKVPAAHYLQFQRGNLRLHRYWKAEFSPDESRPLSYFVEGIEAKLRDSVANHLTGDVPRGAFLSSGIDSSTIAALMTEREPLQTFTVGFEEAPEKHDELTLARKMAEHLGSQHHEVRVSAKTYLQQLPRLMYSLEDPIADASAMGLYFVAEAAREHVTVVLSGEGADEIFGGYPIYHEPVSLRMFDYIPATLRFGLGKVAQRLPYGLKGRSFLMRGSVPLESRFLGNANIFADDAKRRLLPPREPFSDLKDSYSAIAGLYRENQSHDDITRMQLIDINTWLPGDILMKADKMTMANALELRVPFLDRELFEFAATVPAKYRIAAGTTKYALRQAAARIVPHWMSTRPKLGFPVPIRRWICTDMLEFIHDLFASGAAREFINREYALVLLQEHCSGRRDRARELWTVVTFLLWYDIFLDGTSSYTCQSPTSSHTQRHRLRTQRPVQSLGT